jgi:carbamoyl-phosphate synthase large subunit
VKAAVLPFARFPGADPVLGPEMRSTGEVMASASDLPTAFAKAERAAGRGCPRAGPRSSRCATRTRTSVVPVAQALAGLGFRLLATAGTARTLAVAGLAVEYVRKVTRRATARPSSTSSARAAATSSSTRRRAPGARTDGYRIREAALVARVPCITTLSGAAAAVEAIAHARDESRSASRSGSMLRREARRVAALEPVGPTRSCASSRTASSRECPGSSSCSRRLAGCCRGR